MAKSLLYVSRSLIAPTDREAIVADIVTVSHSRNASVGVTGALISTEAAFAQILEGPAAAVDELMLRIRRDSRHTDVAVVLVEEVAHRRFPDWAMAYRGAVAYLRGDIQPLLEHPGRPDAEPRARQLVTSMSMWVRG
jgi:hypothetical protein